MPAPISPDAAASPTLEALGDSALILRFGTDIDAPINAQVHFAAAVLRAAKLDGMQEIVPAYASLTVHYDSTIFASADVSPFTVIGERLRALLAEPNDAALRPSRMIEIPVCYGGEFGPDLADVAAHSGLAESAVIALHSGADYRVAMLGFAPGFPYLLGLDERLHAPRRANPRVRVPIGSVANGGQQTGIYPGELPGGWHLIGRTPLRLFDSTQATPALLGPNDHVRFVAIDAAEFARLRAGTK